MARGYLPARKSGKTHCRNKFGCRVNVKRSMTRGVLLAAILAAAGCASLPTTGPTASQVLSNGDNSAERRYVIADLDERAIAILARLPGPSFRARFGDYRPAPESRIGIGDEVRVMVWEAAAGGLFSGSGPLARPLRHGRAQRRHSRSGRGA